MAGEYTPLVVGKGLSAFCGRYGRAVASPRAVDRARRGAAGRGRQGAGRAAAGAAADVLHRLPGAAGVLGHEAAAQGDGAGARVGRHRLPLVRDLRAVQPGQLDPGLRHVARLRRGGLGHADQPADQRHGRRRLLAQRPDHRRRRRRVQQGRQRADRHEQRLFQRHRPAGHPLQHGGGGRPRQGPRHRGGAEEHGRAVDQARAHLWRHRRGQHAARGAAHRRRRASR